jgi:hypothetical protein
MWLKPAQVQRLLVLLMDLYLRLLYAVQLLPVVAMWLKIVQVLLHLALLMP